MAEVKHIGFELLADYDCGIVDGETEIMVRRHLHNCDLCAGILKGIKRFREEQGDDEAKFEAYFSVSPPPKPKRNFPWRTLTAIAASIALLLLTLPRLVSDGGDFDRLLESEFQDRYRNPVIERSGNGGERYWKNGAFAYRDGKFDEGAIAFRAFLTLNPGDLEARFYLGTCCLYDSAFGCAIENLKIVSLAEGNYKLNAYWYLGLAYHQYGNSPKATETWKKISETEGHFKRESAQSLLNASE